MIYLVISLDMAKNAKPLVAIACFCEQILEEPDGVISAIRIVDTYIIPALPEGVQLPDGAISGLIVTKGLISLKSGDFQGTGRLHLVMNKTTGEKATISPEGGWPVEMKGGEHGFNVKLQMPLGVKNFGLVWFDVIWNDEVLTRIPLMLRQGTRPDEANAPS